MAMDKKIHEAAQEAIRLLGSIMPERARLIPFDRDFVEDLAGLLNRQGANAMVTERKLSRLRALAEDLRTHSESPSKTKATAAGSTEQ